LTATPPAPTPTTRRRIGLFGGSFDPVHQAHLALARAALDQLQLDELRWMPAGQPWQKARALQPAVHRAAMVELAIAAEPRFVLERCEIERTGPSYTLDSLDTLQTGALDAALADWYLLIGQDQYANFTRWHGWQAILQRATLAVAGRGGSPVAPPAELATWLAAATAGPAPGAAPRRPVTIDLPPHAHAATTLRERLAQGLHPDALAPAELAPEVAGYIARHGLYTTFPPPARPRA
jgi:nicotinate-nucleotide adenylyltransferase